MGSDNKCVVRCDVALASAAVVLMCAIAGCGYHILDARAPLGAHRIAIVPFKENRAVGISARLAEELSRLIASGGVAITTDRSSASAVLVGEVLGESTVPAPWPSNQGSVARAYRSVVMVRATLVDPNGKSLWQHTVSGDELFQAPGGGGIEAPSHIESKRRMALGRVADLLARRLYELLCVTHALRHPDPES